LRSCRGAVPGAGADSSGRERLRAPWQGAFDLRKFPHDQRERFVNSVIRGKNQMPAWGESLKPDELEALWAYVVSAESLYGH
jgi:mono/diheme cytochrome c family protein